MIVHRAGPDLSGLPLSALLRPAQPPGEEGSQRRGEDQPEHDHPGDPEEENVVAGLKHGCRVEEVQIVVLIGPTESRMRPQTGREPGIEHVRVLLQFRGAALAALVRVLDRSRLFAAVPVGPTLPTLFVILRPLASRMRPCR